MTHSTTHNHQSSCLMGSLHEKVNALHLPRRSPAPMYFRGCRGALRSSGRLQSASGEELSALMTSILDQAFKGVLSLG